MTLPATLGEALALARGQLAPGEARLLLREASGASAAQVAAFPERALDTAAATRYCDWLARRIAGEPVAYLLGEREFYGRMFATSPAVLIPRPDTECLVEAALARIRQLPAARVVDLGTGSGAIAVTLALEAPQAVVCAVDVSSAALAVAQDNARRLGGPVRFVLGDWLAPLAGERFDLIVSNPPYIAAEDEHLGQGDLRFEPRSALASGADGLDDIRRIVTAAPAQLVPGGWLLLEHGYQQGEPVRDLLAQAGLGDIETLLDLAGNPRVSVARKP